MNDGIEPRIRISIAQAVINTGLDRLRATSLALLGLYEEQAQSRFYNVLQDDSL